MQLTKDTALTFAACAVVASLSASAFARAEYGDPTRGWQNGSYQRTFEEGFERSIPSQEGASAIWSAAKWVLFSETAEGAVAGRGGWLFTAEEFTAPSEPRDLATEVARVSVLLAADGIELLPVIIPDKARMQAHRLPRGRSAAFERRYDEALETLAQAGLPALDLRVALDFEASFMRTDTHWSPAGARAVADAIAVSLEGKPLPRTRVDAFDLDPIAFDGDLIAFVETGPLRPYVGPAAETIGTFETSVAQSGGLFGDAEVPVALVGTSYSAKADFHFEGFLKRALEVDVLNAATIGRGPFHPMDVFLSERASLSSQPMVVVWEIPERYLALRSPN